MQRSCFFATMAKKDQGCSNTADLWLRSEAGRQNNFWCYRTFSELEKFWVKTEEINAKSFYFVTESLGRIQGKLESQRYLSAK